MTDDAPLRVRASEVAAGEWTEIEEWVQDLAARGTSAMRQRRTWLRTGDLREVAAGIVREGAVGGA